MADTLLSRLARTLTRDQTDVSEAQRQVSSELTQVLDEHLENIAAAHGSSHYSVHGSHPDPL